MSQHASIAIAAHNEGDLLLKTVASCLETTEGLDCEVVIADDASTDGSLEAVRERFPEVRIVAHPERRGVAATKDLAGRAARGEVLLFLDGHCKPEPGAIARIVADVEDWAGEAVISPGIAALDAETWTNRLDQVGHGYNLELESFDVGWIGLDRMRPEHAPDGRAFYRQPTVIGCCVAMSRRTYERLWGFDSGMKSYGAEDIDFGLKAWLMGTPVLHDPEPLIGHRFRSGFDTYAAPVEHVVANQLRMAWKNFEAPVWQHWVNRLCALHPSEFWEAAWSCFVEGFDSLERERTYLMAHRTRDEYWYAAEFDLDWPREGMPMELPTGRPFRLQTTPSPSVPPTQTPPPPRPIGPQTYQSSVPFRLQTTPSPSVPPTQTPPPPRPSGPKANIEPDRD